MSTLPFVLQPDKNNDARLRYLVGLLHDLGPRSLYEFIRELEQGADLRDRLETYARLPRNFIAACGGDLLPPAARLLGGRSRR
jgi:hypothetical protein